MNYTCPRCNQIMICVSTASIPAITSYQCMGCGYSSKPIREQSIATPLPEWLRQEEKPRVYVKDLNKLPECYVCPFSYFDADWGFNLCSWCDEPVTMNGRLGDCPLYEEEE